jgi:hypothetical protein
LRRQILKKRRANLKVRLNSADGCNIAACQRQIEAKLNPAPPVKSFQLVLHVTCATLETVFDSFKTQSRTMLNLKAQTKPSGA